MRPASNLWHAPKLAEAIGYPFTHFITANLQNAGCPTERASERRHLAYSGSTSRSSSALV